MKPSLRLYKRGSIETQQNATSLPDRRVSIRHNQVVDGATHFQMKTLKHVSTEMALYVLAYMRRAISILGVGGLMDEPAGCACKPQHPRF
jgi:hypothetical protein